MSLVAFGVRVAAIRMLRGATLAGAAVYDSPIDPVPQALSATTPLIHVYTESETTKFENTRDLMLGKRELSLTLQIFIPVDQKISFGGTNIEIASRRGGGQAVLDVIYRQVERSFCCGQSVWHELFQGLVDGYKMAASRPYVIQTDKGVRLAAREIELMCEVQDSPRFGPNLTDLWTGLVSAMKADPDLKVLAPYIEAEIIGDPSLSQDQADAFLLGLSKYEAETIGVLPLVQDINADADLVATDEISAVSNAPLPDGYEIIP